MRVTLVISALAVTLSAQPLWLDVPFVHQDENGCGSASLAMVIDYWRAHGAAADPANVDAIQRELYVAARKGIPAESMTRYLEQHGFEAIAFRGEWEDLEHHLALGRPLIVALRVRGATYHYAVAAGISPDAIALNDPADRKLRQYDRARFEKEWNRAGAWTLLAVPLAASRAFPPAVPSAAPEPARR
jgi:ABC-type bacteriocin/lantibiotic exporter with double-glycine peptidase domain